MLLKNICFGRSKNGKKNVWSRFNDYVIYGYLHEDGGDNKRDGVMIVVR